MDTIDVIRRVMRTREGAGIAMGELREMISALFDRPRLQQKARQGKRYLDRWVRYELLHELTDEDFLLVLRDTVLMLGKFAGTPVVSNLVGMKGESFGLYLETSGEIAAKIPKHSFVRQCYGLEDTVPFPRKETVGDRLLMEETGFTSYKSFEQKTAVHSALTMPEGSTLLVTLSTGEGKSMVTQMSVARNSGLTILIVPTTALGKDQARAAVSVLKRVPKEAIWDFCGDQTTKLPELKEKLARREVRLLITSPEALVKNVGLRAIIEKAAEEQYASRLIIDEAHIVQDWGASFRSDFQFLSVIRREMLKKSGGRLRTVLLSATLTENAVSQLQELFSEKSGLKTNWIPVRCDSLRTEIRYMTDTLKYSDQLEEEQQKKILQYVKTLPKPMLIYTIRPDDAQKWWKFLRVHGIQNTATFTGLTEDAERSEIIKNWSEDKLDIVVATSAFGMGIDKPDVRTVMHVVMPESINRFYQEVGRGGRDGLPSLSMLCCCPQIEYHQASGITHRKIMTWEKMIRRWFEMIRDGVVESDVVELNTRSVPDYFDEKEKKVSGNRNRDWNLHTILFMVRHGWIEFVDMKYIAETDDYLIRVRMKDPVLLQDETRMAELGKAARESEYDAADRELKVFQEMIREQDHQCFAECFTRIYEKTNPDCGGCPEHGSAHYHSSRYRLHSYMARYADAQEKNLPFRYWHKCPCLVVNRSNQEDMDQAAEIAVKLMKAGIFTWIQSDSDAIRRKAVEYPGLVLNLAEAQELLDHHPSLLGPGVLLTLGKDVSENQRMLDFGCRLLEKGTSVAFHMKEDTVCAAYGKPVQQVFMSRTMSEQELK